MSLLPNIVTDEEIKTETDSVGGGGVLESGLYPMEITMAYLGKADSGADSITVHLKTKEGRETRQTLWITSGDAKGNKNFYEKDGERFFLPGFNVANSMALLTVGKPLNDLDSEEKTIKLYNYDAKAEVPTKVQVVTSLIGQTIIAGIQRQTVDKNVKNGEGKYVPSGDTRDVNEIDKFFRARDNMTTAEIRAGATEAAFYPTWGEKWTGVTRDRSTKNVTQPAAGGQAATVDAPKNSLFGA